MNEERREDPLAESIVSGVLARTTGSVCDSAEARLHAFVTSTLEREQSELLAGHVELCPRCRALAEVLTWLDGVCREMAFIEPPRGFLDETMALTRRVRSPRVFARRLRRRWVRASARPLLPLEIAYGGALLSALLIGAPLSPLRPAMDEAARLSRTNPVEVVVAAAHTGGTIGGVVNAARFTAGSISRRVGATHAVLGEVREHAQMAIVAVWAGDVGRVGVELETVGGDLERVPGAVLHGVTGDSKPETER